MNKREEYTSQFTEVFDAMKENECRKTSWRFCEESGKVSEPSDTGDCKGCREQKILTAIANTEKINVLVDGEILDNQEGAEIYDRIGDCNVCGKASENLLDGICEECREKGRYKKRKKETKKDVGIQILIELALIIFFSLLSAAVAGNEALYAGAIGGMSVAFLRMAYDIIRWFVLLFSSKK